MKRADKYDTTLLSSFDESISKSFLFTTDEMK